MPGPLPKSATDRRRRNAPVIPTTRLPMSGRQGTAPRPPGWMPLGKSGKAWWQWAWKTPQAAAWAKGHEVFVARRAQLEDDLAAIELVDGLDVAELLGVEADDRSRFVEGVIRKLHSLASGRLALLKEARELEDRLGLNPKAMAALRWQIVADPVEQAPAEGDAGEAEPRVTSLTDRRRRLAAGAS